MNIFMFLIVFVLLVYIAHRIDVINIILSNRDYSEKLKDISHEVYEDTTKISNYISDTRSELSKMIVLGLHSI